jgi:hypothetical protein
LDHDPPSYASCVFWITGVYHHAWLVGWHESLLTFCLGWPQAMIFWISTSQVSEITGVHHSTWLIFFSVLRMNPWPMHAKRVLQVSHIFSPRNFAKLPT